MMHRIFPVLTLVVASLTFAGCGSSSDIGITGTLLKGGAKYTPPAGRQVGITFYNVEGQDQDRTAPPSGEPYVAEYSPTDATFTVPGREGNGIPRGKYRIAISRKLTRETFDLMKKTEKPKRGQVPITRETDELAASYGPTSSPIVRDLKLSKNVTIDMDKPTEE